MIERSGESDLYSTSVVANGLVFLCGLTPLDRSGDVRRQTLDVLHQIDRHLAAAGTDKSRLLSVIVWLKDVETVDKMNEAWREWADPAALPARATVQARMLREDTVIEIMAQAAL